MRHQLFYIIVQVNTAFCSPDSNKNRDTRSRRGGGGEGLGGDACVALGGITTYSPILLNPTHESLQLPTESRRQRCKCTVLVSLTYLFMSQAFNRFFKADHLLRDKVQF
jgi:hypothetical protein